MQLLKPSHSKSLKEGCFKSNTMEHSEVLKLKINEELKTQQ